MSGFYRKGWGQILAFGLADLAAFTLAFAIGAIVTALFSEHMAGRTAWDLLDQPISVRSMRYAAFATGVMGWFAFCGHYTQRLPFWTQMHHLISGCILGLLGHGFLQYALKDDFSRLWLVNSWLVSVPLLICLRILGKTILRHYRLWDISVLVIGQPSHVSAATAMLQSDTNMGLRAVGYLGFDQLPNQGWTATCAQYGAEQVVLVVEDVDLPLYRDQIARLVLDRIPFLCVQSMAGLPVFSLRPHYLVGHDVLLLIEQGRMNFISRLVKSAFDRLIAMLLLIILLPLIGLLAILVASDGGGVIFRHPRLGRHGRMFNCLKFRTMVPNAQARLDDLLRRDPAARQQWDRDQKLTNDPRITRLGRLMRAYSLDELPQLWNVLAGHMSLVGPRPIVVDEQARFGDELEFYFQVQPGITGLWQVNGRNDLDYSQRIRLNTWYVKNWSLWLDLVILLKTVPTVLSRRGAS